MKNKTLELPDNVLDEPSIQGSAHASATLTSGVEIRPQLAGAHSVDELLATVLRVFAARGRAIRKAAQNVGDDSADCALPEANEAPGSTEPPT